LKETREGREGAGFIAAAHNARVPEKIGASYFAVDSSCIVPTSRHDHRAFAAYTIRPKITRELPKYLRPVDPIELRQRWNDRLRPPDLRKLRTEVTPENLAELVADCEIDHGIRPSISFTAGAAHARNHLEVFLKEKLSRYACESSKPSQHATSDLSPYLHFGQISALEVALAARAYAEQHRIMAGAFLEELIVRRELAFNFARFASDTELTLPR
jgi:deoxyribodipyrimidine photo-lyase